MAIWYIIWDRISHVMGSSPSACINRSRLIQALKRWQPTTSGYCFHLDPRDPSFLGGWCYGGIVSVEMAQQLLAQGHQVDLLVLIDTWAPRPDSKYYRYYLNRVGCFLKMGTHGWIRYLWAKVKRKMRNRPQNVSSVLAVDLEYGHLANRKHVLKTNMQAVERYRSRPYPGRVILFQLRGSW